MSYLFKILRVSAWLLLVATPVALISGVLIIKPYLIPQISPETNRFVHLVLIPVIFTPLVYLHSITGIISLMMRHAVTRKKYLQIIVCIVWTLIFAVTVWFFIAPNTKTQSTVLPSSHPITSNGAVLSVTEVAKHSGADSCWMIISGKVYDFTEYFGMHPGGNGTLLKYCGQDGSVGYVTKDKNRPHSSYADSLLSRYYLGDLVK